MTPIEGTSDMLAPESPCVELCVLSEDGSLCLGCHRTPEEIAAWIGLDEAEKRAVLKRCRDREMRRRDPP